jgi:hypothetical protein
MEIISLKLTRQPTSQEMCGSQTLGLQFNAYHVATIRIDKVMNVLEHAVAKRLQQESGKSSQSQAQSRPPHKQAKIDCNQDAIAGINAIADINAIVGVTADEAHIRERQKAKAEHLAEIQS